MTIGSVAAAVLLAFGWQASTSPAPFFVTRGAFIALSVPDIEASARWYADKLALRVVRERSPSPDQKAMTTVLTGNGLIVELVQHSSALPLESLDPKRARRYEVHGIFKAGFLVENLEAALEELERRKVDVVFRIFTDEVLGYRTFAIRDNSGNVIQLFGK